jgi:HSP20 family protein
MLEMTFWSPVRGFQTGPRVVRPVFGDLGRKRSAPVAAGSQGYPRTDVYETVDDFVIRMDVPGLQKGDIRIEYDDGKLTIAGQRQPSQNDGIRYHVKETFSGEFTRSFSLPDSAGSDNISAEVRDGVLTVKIPKREEVKPRRIDVKVA